VPVKIRKTDEGRYRVSTPGGTKAKSTTKKKAKSQARLLRAIDHGFKPRRSRK
jgi:hypothetical protein